jgi:hypothetical protein
MARCRRRCRHWVGRDRRRPRGRGGSWRRRGRLSDFLSIGVGDHVAEEAVESGNGGGSGGGLLGGQGTGCRQDTGIHCPTIVKQIANGYLQFFGLAGSGWGRVVEGDCSGIG